MSGPRASVVIPCFNLGRYLDEAVDSVLAQTFTDFEILIVDDGSTDEATRDLIASYARPKTRVLQTGNGGLSAARNAGARATTGEFLCMFDADDRMAPLLLEKSVEALDADPGLTFVSHWLRTFGDESWEWKPTSCDLPTLLDDNTVNGAALVRRQAFNEVGGFDEAMRDGCEDWDFWLTLAEGGHRGSILSEVLYEYRRRPGSMSRIMVEEGGYARLYSYLARKHSTAFRAYLAPLVSKREQELSALRAHVRDLEIEHYEWLEPEVMQLRDDVAGLERRWEREVVTRQRRAEMDNLSRQARVQTVTIGDLNAHIAQLTTVVDQMTTDVAGLTTRVSDLTNELDTTTTRAAGLGHALEDARNDARRRALELEQLSEHIRMVSIANEEARAEVRALKASRSWTLTRPLRQVFGLFIRGDRKR